MSFDSVKWSDRPVRALRIACLVGAAFGLAACGSVTRRAPVVDRDVAAASSPSSSTGSSGAVTSPVTGESTTDAPKILPGAENAGKPGYYTVKPGDTLIRIGLDSGQNFRDLIRWNNLDNPNVIEVGQVLRVVPPGTDPTVVASRPITSPRIDARPLDVPRPASAPVVVATAPTSGATLVLPAPIAAQAAPPPPVAVLAESPKTGDDDVNWMWPAAGAVGAGFDEAKSKGLSIIGKAGDPVLAAADGRVVYAGSGLRGYGNLVILKHNNTYLTAYAHNQVLLVKEDQNVKRGQKIAEMGSTDSDRVQLHFEIRKQGKPIDPARLLPAR
ncbi:MAG: peptidase [Rhizobacter sp.]|nr:peptidase [Rhizobacter sp.]